MSGDMQRSHALVTLALDNPRGTLDTLRDAELMMLGGGVNKPRLTALIEQIEAQTKPPKPTEPTGLGAVIEDAAGIKWVRTHASFDAHWRRGNFDGNYATYDSLDVVRVLNEGWTA